MEDNKPVVESAAPPAQSQPTKPLGALERVEQLEKVLAGIAQGLKQDGAAFQFIAQKLSHLEQSLAGVAKTVSGVVLVLSQKGLVLDSEIMGEIRKIDDDQERLRVADLKQHKLIVAGEAVQPSSLVIMTQKMLKADGTAEVYSSYRALSMPETNPKDVVYQNALGKKPGEQFSLSGREPGDNMIFTISEVYELANRGGRQAPQPATDVSSAPTEAPAPAPETPATTEVAPVDPAQGSPN